VLLPVAATVVSNDTLFGPSDMVCFSSSAGRQVEVRQALGSSAEVVVLNISERTVVSHTWMCESLTRRDHAMAVQLQKVLYTAEGVAEGGRQGHGRTTDGRLEVDLSVPEEMSGAGGPGTNPEQLFAVGYAACFHSALLGVARGHNLDASQSQITSRVGIGPTGHGGFGLTVALDLHAPHMTAEQAADVMARAHQRCPYSNATRGNIDAELSGDGVLLAAAAKLSP
jgi:osmotically inducible protein OsmC